MKRLLFLGACSVLTVGLVMLLGCSSSTEPTNKVVGDTTNPAFQAAAGVLDLADISDKEMIYSGFSTLDRIVTGTPGSPKHGDYLPNAAVVVDSPVYHGGSSYWYYSTGLTDTTYKLGTDTIIEIVTLLFEDSLQFLHGLTPVQYPDSALLSSVKAGAKWSVCTALSSDTVLAAHRWTVSGTPGSIAGRGQVQINGFGTFHGRVQNVPTGNDSLGTCGATLDLLSAWSGITLNIASVMDSGACPTAGMTMHHGNLAVACIGGINSLNFNGNWVRTATFSGNMVTIVYESPTTRWTVTDTCGQQLAAPPFAQLPQFYTRLR